MPRGADEEGGGPYYRLLPEGHLTDYDGEIIKLPPSLAGLDFNRNFPYDWRPHSDQEGAGAYPTSEPEIRAAVQAIVDRPNITCAVSYHTFGGVLLRPYGARPDDDFPPADLRAYDRMADEAVRLTGYPRASVYHHFQYEPKTWMRGAFDDWIYEHLGVFGWTTEFWSPMRAAGVDVGMRFIDWWKDHPIEDDLKMLAWSDNEMGGRGFIDWYPFEHPQLGPVELGGWDEVNVLSNAPFDRLESGGGAAQRLGRLPGAGVAAAGGAVVHGGAGGRRHPPPAAGGAEHRLAADERVEEGDRAEGRAPRRGGSGAGRRRTAGDGPGAHGAGAADRARRAPSACWAGTRATSRPASGRVSSGWSRRPPARWCVRRRGIRAPASAAPS